MLPINDESELVQLWKAAINSIYSDVEDDIRKQVPSSLSEDLGETYTSSQNKWKQNLEGGCIPRGCQYLFTVFSRFCVSCCSHSCFDSNAFVLRAEAHTTQVDHVAAITQIQSQQCPQSELFSADGRYVIYV